MKWLCTLCNSVMSHLHKLVFKISLSQTEGNGVFRVWAHITLTDISIVWILKSHAGFPLVGGNDALSFQGESKGFISSSGR